MAQDRDRRNLPPLNLHVPEPKFRPGDDVDFSDLEVEAAGVTRRPDETSYPADRSEEHTSELQSLMRISYAVFCLKNKKSNVSIYTTQSHKHVALLESYITIQIHK